MLEFIKSLAGKKKDDSTGAPDAALDPAQAHSPQTAQQMGEAPLPGEDQPSPSLSGMPDKSGEEQPPVTPAPSKVPETKKKEIKPGLADHLAGEAKAVKRDLRPYLPGDLIGGFVPYVPGMEHEAVWNAASQACSTEKVHYTFTVEDGKCWYLACPSHSLASNPDSWCPLAAALPGNSEFWDKETVYLYEQEGTASALRWDPETDRMQVFLGASRTLLPRIQSMDANFVTVNADVADVAPWYNRALMTEKLSRATSRILLWSGLLALMLIAFFYIAQVLATMHTKRDLETVRTNTVRASENLMINASNALQSDTIRHMVRIQELLDALIKIDGTLVLYEVANNRTKWEALVPPTFSNCSGAIAGCQVQSGLEEDGRVRISGAR